MEAFYPRTINRAIIILLPRQPALDWIMRVEPEQEPQTLATMRQDCDALMVSQREVDSVESAQKWVQGNWEMFFEEFLSDWYLDEEVWPEKRTLKMFNQWFEIHYHSSVWDFADEPIEHAEDAEDDQG